MENKGIIKSMLKEAGILFAITLASGLLLGGVYELTKEPVRIQQEKAIQEACAAAFSLPDGGTSAESKLVFEPRDVAVDQGILDELAADGVEIGSIYFVYDGAAQEQKAPCGYVVESVSKKGYGGNIVLYVGVDSEKTVRGVSVLEISETPGLGMEAPNVLVPQFAGKKADVFVYTKTGAAADNEVDAITSATKTTSAVVNAVNGGVRAAEYLMEQQEPTGVSTGGGTNE